MAMATLVDRGNWSGDEGKKREGDVVRDGGRLQRACADERPPDSPSHARSLRNPGSASCSVQVN